MSASPEEFDSVQKLVRLKRYEQPPPRYFNEFSDRIVSRIEAGEGRGSWWEKFGFDLRPAFAAAAGMFACGLVVYGVATTEGGDVTSDGLTMSPELGTSGLSPGSGSALMTSSTNPVGAPYGMPIDHKVFPSAQIIPASFGVH